MQTLRAKSISAARPVTAVRPAPQQRVVRVAAAAAEASENVKLRIRMRGYDISLLEDACKQVVSIADATGCDMAGPVMLPTRRKVYCLLRSPHVDKDAREHFEVRIHNRLIDLKNLSSETVGAMMDWVPPAGVDVQCSVA
jgi:small subunit ribosomal protein S10